MRNAVRAVLGLTMAVLAVFGGLGVGESRQPANSDVSSISAH